MVRLGGGGRVAAVYAATIGSTGLASVETFTIEFETFGFSTMT